MIHYTITCEKNGRTRVFCVDVRSEARLYDVLGRLQIRIGAQHPIRYREAGSSYTVRFVPMRLIGALGGFREYAQVMGPIL